MTKRFIVLGLLAALAVGVGLWFFSSSPPDTFCIIGGSMEPTIAGPHYMATCPKCKFSFRCSAIDVPESGAAACPNCSALVEKISESRPVPGGEVVLEKDSLDARPLKRWEVVALEDPDHPGQLMVKRIVGLPGETVTIKEGEIYINDEIARKPLNIARKMAVVVHDDRFRAAGEEPRWCTQRPSDYWTTTPEGYIHPPSSETGDPTPGDTSRQLEYRNIRCRLPVQREQIELPIDDAVPYNWNSSRKTLQVRDFWAEGDFSFRGKGALGLVALNKTEGMAVAWFMQDGDLTVMNAADDVLNQYELNLPESGTVHIAWGLCDRGYFLAIDGKVIVEQKTASEPPPLSPEFQKLSPFSIGADGCFLEIKNLIIYRDVYYLPSRTPAKGDKATWTLADDEYFLLGDNSPISIDSREHGPFHRSKIHGRIKTK